MVRGAFDRASRWFGNLLAPLIVIAYAKDFKEGLDFLWSHPFLTSGFLLLFGLLFTYNISQDLRLRGRLKKLGKHMRGRKSGLAQETTSSIRRPPSSTREAQVTESSAPAPESADASNGVSKVGTKRTRLSITLALSSAALTLIALTYVQVFVVGIYYVVAASAPDRAAAASEVRSLESALQAREATGLQPRAHASTATGSPWYMTSLGGPHLTRAGAERTLEQARQTLGDRLRSDAYVYSTGGTAGRMIGRLLGSWRE